jgi:TAG lipase/steryl ester hydrolase/phospholipase A2/LPA acyltransferase
MLNGISNATVDNLKICHPTVDKVAWPSGRDTGVDTYPDSFNTAPVDSNLHNGELRRFTARLDSAMVNEVTSSLETYCEFNRAAERLALICGFEDWRNDERPESCEYDVLQLRRRLHDVQKARYSGNPEKMLRLIQTQLSRFVSEVDRETLFHPSLRGTKVLIEEYTDSVCCLLQEFAGLCHLYGNELDRRRLAELLEETRISFGRTALMCSGGGTFGMRHVGTIKCLFETGNLPRVISGSSAGSIVCAVLGSKTDDQLQRVLESFCHGDLKVFIGDDEIPGWAARIGYWWENGHFFDSRNLERVMKFHLGDMTFSEAYELTGRVLNVSVDTHCYTTAYDILNSFLTYNRNQITVSTGDPDGPKVLNYRNAADVMLWSAVVASCALPFTYRESPIYAKHSTTGEAEPFEDGANHVDGSIEADIPFEAVHDEFNVNHAVVAQVNPHAVLFIEDKSAAERRRKPTYAAFLDFLKEEAANWVLPFIPIPLNGRTRLASIIGQKYSGHITILPKDWLEDLSKVLSNPTPQFMEDAKRKGERATWERLSIIENHMKIERALESATNTAWDAVYCEAWHS